MDTVCATDGAPTVGGAASSVDVRVEERLPGAKEGSEILALREVKKDGSLWWVGMAIPMRPDCGYGLLFFEGCFLELLGTASRFEWLCRPPSVEEAAFLKLASFLTHVVKGRLRPERS